ncbi:MAG: hypothetical protein ACK5B9_12900 [Flavobacteriia bacterium]|jgi:hypothetical protein
MKTKTNLVTYVVIGENTKTNERFIYCEVKIKPGEIYPMVHALNDHYKIFYFETVTKEYFKNNIEHYQNVK